MYFIVRWQYCRASNTGTYATTTIDIIYKNITLKFNMQNRNRNWQDKDAGATISNTRP